MEKEILIKSPGKTLIKVTDDSISIIRKGFINLVNQGIKGEKTIPFKNISAVQLKTRYEQWLYTIYSAGWKRKSWRNISSHER